VQDEVVPPAQMRQLKELSTAKTYWRECPNSRHMNAYTEDETIYWEAIKDFWVAEIE
jgi:hypothetical protein